MYDKIHYKLKKKKKKSKNDHKVYTPAISKNIYLKK